MEFSPNTIYKDLMKLVHPDLHPNMPDATVRAQMVNGYKNNTDALKKLAITWGFLKGINTDRTIFNDTFRTRNTLFSKGMGVIIKNGSDRGSFGIIADISLIRIGRNKGKKMYTVYLPDADRFIFFDFPQNENGNMFFENSTRNCVIDVVSKLMIFKQMMKSSLSPWGLASNLSYEGSGFEVLFKNYGKVYTGTLSRTTAKCVVVRMNDGTVKTVKLMSVLDIRR